MTQCRIILLLQPITKLFLFTNELKLQDDFRCFRTFCTVPLNSPIVICNVIFTNDLMMVTTDNRKSIESKPLRTRNSWRNRIQSVLESFPNARPHRVCMGSTAAMATCCQRWHACIRVYETTWKLHDIWISMTHIRDSCRVCRDWCTDWDAASKPYSCIQAWQRSRWGGKVAKG